MDNNNSRMIYAVTKDGSAPTGDGAGVLTGIYHEMNPGTADEPVAIMSGPDLNDPTALSSMLKAGRDDDLVIVVMPDELVPCKTGPGPDGLEAVIGILTKDIEEHYNQTSWEALSQSILEGRKEA